MLVVLGGLPGTGKTTVGRALALRWSAASLRIDEIEQALRSCPGGDPGLGGYAAAQAIARSNLTLGMRVVADGVNPVPASREGWRRTALAAGAAVVEVELVCPGKAEHRRRLEKRVADIPNHACPTWDAVQANPYVPWSEPRLVIDTAVASIADALDAIEAQAEVAGRAGAVRR